MKCADSNPNEDPQALRRSLKRAVVLAGVPASESEDCVQEAFLALLRAHPDWTLDEPKTSAWLHAVARNQARLHHRRLRLRRTRTVADMDAHAIIDTRAKDHPGAGEVGDQKADAAIHAQLARLTEINREILIQRAFGLTYLEIGKGLGLDAEQVRQRYYRTRNRLARDCTHPEAGDRPDVLWPKQAGGGGGIKRDHRSKAQRLNRAYASRNIHGRGSRSDPIEGLGLFQL